MLLCLVCNGQIAREKRNVFGQRDPFYKKKQQARTVVAHFQRVAVRIVYAGNVIAFDQGKFSGAFRQLGQRLVVSLQFLLERWQERKYLDMDQFHEWAAEQEAAQGNNVAALGEHKPKD